LAPSGHRQPVWVAEAVVLGFEVTNDIKPDNKPKNLTMMNRVRGKG
jgi:hypothetical protein